MFMAETEFSRLIRKLRLSRDLSIVAISDLLMIHRSTYSHYERAEHIPTVEVIIRLSNIYRINPMEFFYTLVSEDVRRTNQEMINYNYTNLAMYTRSELVFLQEISTLNSFEQRAVLNMIKALKSQNHDIYPGFL
jgi:transcriptional regulator with XRE-family HTH domain